MTAQFDLDFSGVERVVDKMTRISEDLKPAVHQVMTINIRKMHVTARHIVPFRTGFLKRSIYWKPIGLMRFLFGAAAPYAKHVEYGTSKMKARPFLRPAVSTVWRVMMDEVAVKIRELLERS